ncbi:MAG: PA2169 family four-helix-bundle protein [Ferruginibacter sp.]
MMINNKLIEVLNDLKEINNDRVTGYEKAAEGTKNLDADLHTIFQSMAKDSRMYADELTQELTKLGGGAATGNTGKGKIYLFWMGIKANFSGSDRQTILESCEFGEDTVQRAYNAALASVSELDATIGKMITFQKASLKTSHKLVKNYRDARWNLNAW